MCFGRVSPPLQHVGIAADRDDRSPFDRNRLRPRSFRIHRVDAPAMEDEIGFADLIPASGHGPGGWFDVGQIEVYGKAVAR